MKQLLYIWLAVLVASILCYFSLVYMIANAMPSNCPGGSYSIGINKDGSGEVCKAQPTGCAYGDSIPLDSPKCAPGEVDRPPVTEPAPAAPAVAEPAVDPITFPGFTGK